LGDAAVASAMTVVSAVFPACCGFSGKCRTYTAQTTRTQTKPHKIFNPSSISRKQKKAYLGRPAKEESRFDLCTTKKNTAGLYTNTYGFHNHYDSRSKENTDAGYYTCNSMVDISIRSSFSVGEVSLRPARRRTCARIRRSPTGNRGTVCDKKLDEDCKILFLCSGRTPLLSVAATVVPACTAVLSDWLSSKDDRTASQLAERFRVDTPQRVAEEDHISFLTVSIRGVPTFTAPEKAL